MFEGYGERDPGSLIKTLQAFELSDGDVLVVTMTADATDAEMECVHDRVREWLDDVLPAAARVTTITIPWGMAIEALDEDAMAECGWVRKATD